MLDDVTAHNNAHEAKTSRSSLDILNLDRIKKVSANPINA